LSDFLFRLLEKRQELHGWQHWVFPGKGTNRHLTNVQHIVKEIGKESAPFMLHDLRRTFITMAESLDISTYALKRLINHKMTADITASYIILDVERLRVPMQRVTDALLRAMEEQEPGKVVELRKSK
jgi:integrase